MRRYCLLLGVLGVWLASFAGSTALAAESDVDNDGYSDLVTLRPNGIGYVYPGGTGASKMQFGSGVQSFVSEGNGTLDPSTFDGTGHLPIDVADVTGEGRDDLVTVTGDGNVHVFPGQANRTFGAGVISELRFVRAHAAYRTIAVGNLVDEPIAVADVDGDGNADLVARNSHTLDIEIYAGNSNGTFDPAVANVEDHVYSALGGAWGENFIDVADVTGDGKADLISLPVWQNVAVRPGKVDGSGKPAFDAAVGSLYTAGPVDPSLEDGVGYEPFGVGDVNGDDKADLVLGKDNLSFTYLGEAGGTFSAPVKSFEPGYMISGTFGANAFEVAGVLDVDGNGRGELIYAGPGGNVNAAEGKANGTFNSVAQSSFSGTFKSTRFGRNQDANGNEIVTEKPISRRWGCRTEGCLAQNITSKLRRVFALENENLDIDGLDDERIDVDVAVVDTGVDVQHPDLNVVDSLDCTKASPENEYRCESDSPNDGDMADPSVYGASHGTDAALTIGALDNGQGPVGVAPGARIWGIKQNPSDVYEKYRDKETVTLNLDATQAALKWVIATHEDPDPINDIDVLSIGFTSCPPVERSRIVCPGGIEGAQSKAIETAISEVTDLGVVVVTSSGNWQEDTTKFHYKNSENKKNYIVASAIADSDGLAGGKGPETKACAGVLTDGSAYVKDDLRDPSSGYGKEMDVASPGGCGSGAFPNVGGAAAVLASASDPDSRAEVDAIRSDMVAAGNSGWTDTSPDGVHEPLLDVSDEEVFAPDTLPGCDRPGVRDVDSDVDGDGYADLVSLRPDGRLFVYPGSSSRQFGTGVESYGAAPEGQFVGHVGDAPLNPAQYDGVGHHVVDVADVSGDGCADVVALNSDGKAYVYPGRPDRRLGFAVTSFNVPAVKNEAEEVVTPAVPAVTPAVLDPGGHEPIAAADVNGDVYADLITYDDQERKVMVYPGRKDGSFGTGIVARANVASALHTGAGHYFVDAADVTGDRRADLLSMHASGDLSVFVGQADGTFAAPVVSYAGSVEPAMDDGSGYEPVGLGDVTGDGKADLMLIKAGVGYLYPGQASGALGSAVTSFTGGAASSTTFQAGVFELFGVIDVDGDGRADLSGLLTSDNKVRVSPGETSGVFASLIASEGTILSTQHFKNQNSSGNELVGEKPSWRRRGCATTGCGAEGKDTIGIFRPSNGTWNLRNANSAGAADLSFAYNWGALADVPVTGDWDGDGDETIGMYRPGDEAWYMRNANSSGATDITFKYALADLPVVGDWDGDGIDTIGMYEPVVGEAGPGEGTWHLRNANSAGSADHTFVFYAGGANDIPVAGDWDGDGIDTIGIYRPSNGTWYLRNSNSAGAADLTFAYTWNVPADIPVAGDWDGDGDDTVGMYRPGSETWSLRNSNSAGAADLSFKYSWGGATDIPVVGDWDGA